MANNVKPKKKTSYRFNFHNCAICRAMNAADKRGLALSAKELKDAFKQQEEKKKI